MGLQSWIFILDYACINEHTTVSYPEIRRRSGLDTSRELGVMLDDAVEEQSTVPSGRRIAVRILCKKVPGDRVGRRIPNCWA